jgi:hypothetical protein
VEPQPTAKTIEIKIKMRFILLSLTSDDNQQDDEPEEGGIVRAKRGSAQELGTRWPGFLPSLELTGPPAPYFSLGFAPAQPAATTS